MGSTAGWCIFFSVWISLSCYVKHSKKNISNEDYRKFIGNAIARNHSYLSVITKSVLNIVKSIFNYLCSVLRNHSAMRDWCHQLAMCQIFVHKPLASLLQGSRCPF